jgi:transposase
MPQSQYSEAFKSKMVQRMSGPNAMTATALSREVGIHQSTLSAWLRRARVARLPAMSGNNEEQTVEKAAVRTAEEKARILFEASGCSQSRLGELLRREGVYEAELDQWRAALDGRAVMPSKSSETRRIKDLERELRRKDKALAEMTALAVLRKKAEAIWGAGVDDTDDPSA